MTVGQSSGMVVQLIEYRHGFEHPRLTLAEQVAEAGVVWASLLLNSVFANDC